MLIVDDDINYLNTLQSLIEAQGWLVERASTAGDALQLMTNFEFDFILLDWNLPDSTGPDICRKYRGDGGETPIIFLTGRGEVADKEAGLDAGGDDYLTKPFDIRELLARIRTIQRRQSRFAGEKFKLHDIEFDPRLRLVSRNNETAQLSPIESSMLECLFRHPNTLYSSAKLFASVWPSETEASDETVRVHMRVIRRKLALLGCEDLIKTVRGSGYVIETNPRETRKNS
jgi:DNA-binding response OmpR family regulator